MKYLSKYKFKISRYTRILLNIYQTYLQRERERARCGVWAFFPCLGLFYYQVVKSMWHTEAGKSSSSIARHGFFLFFRCAFLWKRTPPFFLFFRRHHHHRHRHRKRCFPFIFFPRINTIFISRKKKTSRLLRMDGRKKI